MEGRSHIPVTACAGPQLEARRTDSDGLATVAHLFIKRHGSAFFSRRVLQYPCGPRERRVQGGAGRGVRGVRGGELG